MDGIWNDVRYAARTFSRSPAFTVLAVTTLTIGIGAATAVFALLNAVSLKPLPYPEADRLVALVNTRNGTITASSHYVSAPRIRAWKNSSTALSEVAVYLLGASVNLTEGSRPQQVIAARVSEAFFTTFGARATRGRTLTSLEDRPGAADVAILSEAFWRAQFGSDPAIVGRTIALNRRPTLVIGVLDGAFDSRSLSPTLIDPPDIWIPLRLDPNTRDDANNLIAVARVLPAATLEEARAQAAVASNAFRRDFPGEQPPENSFSVVPLRTIVEGDTRASLLLLFGAVGLVALIVSVNTSNLLLGRASARRQEFAIRAALGATRGRIMRQLLIECVLLATAAAIAGLAVAAATGSFLLRLQTVHIPRLGPSSSFIDASVVLFAGAMSITIALVFGIAPALFASQTDVDADLRSSIRSGPGPRHTRTRNVLLVTEVAVANALVIASMLLVRSLVALHSVDPGFDKRNVLTFKVAFADSRFSTTRSTMRVIDSGLEQLRQTADVESVAVSLTGVPLQQGGALRVEIPGRVLDRQYVDSWGAVTLGYFDVFKIPLLRGRLFDMRDGSGAPPVVIINETMARQLWADRDPLHDRVLIGRGGGPAFEEAVPREIVGIVRDVPQNGLNHRPIAGMYVPIAQLADPFTAYFSQLGLLATWAVRTRSAPAQFIGPIRQTFLQSTELPVARVRTMDDVVQTVTAPTALNMWMMTAFAVVAVALAVIGLYAIAAYSVEQRRHELGIRLALGADPPRLRNHIIAESMRWVCVGIGIGVAFAAAMGSALRSFLFGVTVHDPMTYVTVPVLLSVAALVGVYIPGRRAAGIDPVVALRDS